VYSEPQDSWSGTTSRPVSPVSPEVKARAIWQLLFWLLILTFIFLVSTTAFLRWSRHFRRSLLRKPHEPTPSEDVWAMHKLPEGAVEEWTDAGPPGPDLRDRPDRRDSPEP
ncbi:MAG TPA: hypothetical protein PLS23_01620, partial [Phycisphaerae bacterium]|nr:hypothetical protein [Phycisphaerae bacterium]